MRKLALFAALGVVTALSGFGAHAQADGPSGSTECHMQDDDCDGTIDEDTGAAADDNDGDGLVDEDTGTILDDNDGDGAFDEDGPDGIDNDGDGLIDEDPPDDDGDGLVDEDPADDDGDGLINEDPPGNAAANPGENQVDCNEGASQDVNGLRVYGADNGVEVCNEGGNADAPQGRLIVTSDGGGYVVADGDGSNAPPANGYLRVDGGGPHCGDDLNQDSTADQTNNTSEDCDPSAS